MDFVVFGPQNARRVPHVRVAGVPAALISEKGLMKVMLEDCGLYRAGRLRLPITVMDTNGQAVSLYARDSKYADAIEKASIVHADGQFLVTASRLHRQKIPERTATTDLIHTAAICAAESGLTFFLLGGSEDVNAACAERLVDLYPNLKIAGRRSGFFSESEEDEVIAEINKSGADIVWVGLGKPREQLFVNEARNRISCAWIVTCGGCFNFVTGGYSRAPIWMQKSGMEWVHRMFTGPRYLVSRYLTTVPHALWLTFYWAVARRDQDAHRGAAQHGPASRPKPGTVLVDDIFHAAQATGLEVFEESPPVDVRLGEGNGHAKHPAALVGAIADRREHGGVADVSSVETF